MMKIKQLQLRNYGRFEDLTINFAPTDERASNVTVIVGNNGAGKSQILQALAVSLSRFIVALGKNLVKNNGLEIDRKSILNGKNDSEIALKVGNYAIETSWKVYTDKDNSIGAFSYDRSFFDTFIENYKNKSNISLPLIVFYPVERAILGNNEALVLEVDNNPLSGYHNALEGISIQFSNFLQWFRQQEDIENEMLRLTAIHIDKQLYKHYEATQEIDKIFKEYDNLMLNLGENTENITEIQTRLENLKKQREKYEVIIKDSEKIKNMSEYGQLHLLSLLSTKKAIEYFTDFKNIHIERQGTPTMIVEKDGEELDVNQLSQGEKSLLALVGDIARRLAILNPSLDDPLQGEGVVMIDEVDLHLHPKWQHDLIDKLVRTFPKVQFILTTHSPHIVSDRQDILVYSLDNGQLQTIGNVYGEDANTVLNDVFHVPYRTPEIDKAFNGIRRAISHKELESAESQINNIAKKVSSSNTELLKVRLMLAQAKLTRNKVS
ncbi:hypothetical protein EN873_38835 [bacterium M00.F.Ca.ET.230.01.1.1]|nr:hypothetical protein EN873_38835 [bacterium M00.F.Ca.ET.230.01.1.1]